MIWVLSSSITLDRHSVSPSTSINRVGCYYSVLSATIFVLYVIHQPVTLLYHIQMYANKHLLYILSHYFFTVLLKSVSKLNQLKMPKPQNGRPAKTRKPAGLGNVFQHLKCVLYEHYMSFKRNINM